MKIKRRSRRLRGLPVNSLIPNILTVLALCAGMSAIRFAMQDQWQLAVAAIIIAGILDGLDGRMARLLKGATKFGAELDSLSDFIAFGVAPALVIYLWSTTALGGVGWIAGLAYSTCCALRLARFNTALDNPDRPLWASNFFTGMAAPAGACVALLPMAISFQIEGDLLRGPIFMTVWLLLVAFMMISQIPTYSFKRVRIRRELVLPLLVVVGIVAAVLFSYPWFVLSVLGALYLASIPFSYRAQRRLAAAQDNSAPELEADDGLDEEGGDAESSDNGTALGPS
ncbi:MAG: phosphatidylcholine/phosphatidylserine synthase [Alphaproteobacteria bacterium]|nr:phosphatidylcholine/phosphatidylserine synthase [Alphaproteobacteria bacterium]MBL6953010.1 phosphatidylcholine/phosphatidylserine synthase [Alphaproteobacteria bacterium]